MTAQQATPELFLTAYKALPRREQEDILGRIASDRRLRRVPEDMSDRPAIDGERGKPSRPLRDIIDQRERRERGALKAARS
jgi:4'-phosphopantetheinyl transferase EntD